VLFGEEETEERERRKEGKRKGRKNTEIFSKLEIFGKKNKIQFMGLV
jgi:hypothetical protein